MYRRAFFSLVRPQGFALVSLMVTVLVFFLGVLGGELTLTGKGVLPCEHCGTDVFLPSQRRRTRKKTAPSS